MRRSQRLIAAAVLTALCSALAGCGGGGMANFDPSDMLDFLDTKKKLAGDRKPVFPEGVPGLEQGVPKELYKGSQQEQLDQQNAAAAAAQPAPPPEPPKGAKKHTKRAAPSGSGGRSRRRDRRGRARRGAAGPEAEEDRPPPHHRAARRRPAGAACGTGPAADPDHATIRRRVPRAATERRI